MRFDRVGDGGDTTTVKEVWEAIEARSTGMFGVPSKKERELGSRLGGGMGTGVVFEAEGWDRGSVLEAMTNFRSRRNDPGC